MLPRPAILAATLAASVGVPYAISHRDDLPGLGNFGRSDAVAVGEDWNPGPEGHANMQVPGAPGQPAARSVNDVPLYRLQEVLRFDLGKQWVYARWPRVSTGIGGPELSGLRVPLVTGKTLADLAGSLTYYFNQQGQLERIDFHGHTGDPSRLIHFVMTYYGLRRGPSAVASEHVYQTTWNGRVQSELRTRPEPVLRADSPHSAFTIDLQLYRPGSNRFLDPPLPLDLPPSTPRAASEAARTTPAAAESESAAAQEPAPPHPAVDTYRRRWPN